MNSKNGKWKIALLLAVLFFVGPVALSTALAAGGEITARYSQPRGKKIRWSVVVPDPAPAAMIVIQNIPPGTDIISARPAFSSYDKRSGVVKWLLSGIEPGRRVMTMKLSVPIRRKGEIHGRIIFQDSASRATASTSMVLIPKAIKKAIEGC